MPRGQTCIDCRNWIDCTAWELASEGGRGSAGDLGGEHPYDSDADLHGNDSDAVAESTCVERCSALAVGEHEIEIGVLAGGARKLGG